MAWSRRWAYHQNYPRGIIFEDEKSYNDAIADGAVDNPKNINREPPKLEIVKPKQKRKFQGKPKDDS